MPEDQSYGLYAYIVLPHPPANAAEAAKQRALYNAFRQAFPRPKELTEEGVPPSDIAVTYWLVDGQASGAEIVRRDQASDARFFVTHYDYVRAQIILARLQRLGQDGPFIVAAVRPLDGSSGDADTPILVLNFGSLRTEDYPKGMAWYQRRVTRAPETWRNKFDMEGFRLSIRSAVGQYAESALTLTKLIGGGAG